MPNVNKVILIGHVTRDPELRHISQELAVCDFSLAINRSWSKDGQKKEEVTFVDISAFGKQAEVIAEYVKKGNPFYVEGRLKLESWEKDGEKRSKLKVICENFQFLSSKDGGEDRPQPQRTASTFRQHAPLPKQEEYGGESMSQDPDLPF